MDPLLAAAQLPKLAEQAARSAIVTSIAHGRMTPRSLINDALVQFERRVQSEAPDGLRPALLFAERDRIVRELRGFIDGRLASRLSALRKRDIVAVGAEAAPFDLIVRNSRERCYGIVLRRLPADGRRLDLLNRIQSAAGAYKKTPLSGVFLYDFASGSGRLVKPGRREGRGRLPAYALLAAV